MARCTWVGAMVLALAFSVTARTQGQNYVYTFDTPPDPTSWPAPPTGLLPDYAWYTDQGVVINNFTGNNLFFDDGYQAAGNSSFIDGAAVWGNPVTATWNNLNIDFFDLTGSQGDPNGGSVMALAFDWAWTASDDYLFIHLWDAQGNYESMSPTLTEQFLKGPAFGGPDPYGWAGHVEISPFGTLQNIQQVEINLNPVRTLGGTEEFALDNLIFGDTLSGGGDPADSSLVPGEGPGTLIGVSTFVVRTGTPGIVTLAAGLRNEGVGDTTYTATVSGALTDMANAVNAPIAAGEYLPNASWVSLDRLSPSGLYESTVTFHNDLNPADPDEDVWYRIKIYDPAQVTANTTTPLDPAVDGQVSLANAPAGPHANALRASVEVTGVQTSLSRFDLTGIDAGMFIDPGQTLQGQVTFNPVGALAGDYVATLTLGVKMVVDAAEARPDGTRLALGSGGTMDDVVWNLMTSVPVQSTAQANLTPGASFATAGLLLSGAHTAAAIVAGTSSSTQSVSLQFAAAPSGNGLMLLGSAVNIVFGQVGDPYTLTLTYDDASLAAGLLEDDLRLYFFSVPLNDWTLAVLGNSDGGAGASFFAMGWDDYLLSLGGALPVLGAHGLDTLSNQLWAVLDHNTLFSAAAVPEPATVLVMLLAGASAIAHRPRRRR